MQKNVIFDFDSTLIKGESLEILLEPILKNNKDKLDKISEITNLGMSGDIDFKESLEKRLEIAQPSKSLINNFVDKNLPNLFSEGTVDLIKYLHANNINVWIFSGGLSDCIKPFAKYLDIAANQVVAVEVNWNANGEFISVNESNMANVSKVEAMKKISSSFTDKTIIVGDGYTDFQLYNNALADDFVAYIEHESRANVLDVAKHTAYSMKSLQTTLGRLFNL